MAIDQLAAFTVAPKQSAVSLAAVTGIAVISGAEWAESFTLSNPGPQNLYLQTSVTTGTSGVGIIIEPGRNASFPTGNGNDLYVQGTPSGSCTITWHDEA